MSSAVGEQEQDCRSSIVALLYFRILVRAFVCVVLLLMNLFIYLVSRAEEFINLIMLAYFMKSSVVDIS